MLRFAAIRLEVVRPLFAFSLALLTLPKDAVSRPEVTYLGDLNFRVNVDLEDLAIGTVEIESQTYRTFDLPGARHLRGDSLVGLPDLPVLDLAALLPEGTQVASIDTVRTTVMRLLGEYLPAPIQPEPDPRNPRPPAPPNPQVYGSRFPYPLRVGQEGRDGAMRGFFLGGFQVAPIRFYGLYRRIEVLTEIEIHVRVEPFDFANRGPIRNRSDLRGRYSAHGDELRWLRTHVMNASELDVLYPSPHGQGRGGSEQTPHGGFIPTERPSESGPPVAYVVITNNTNIHDVEIGDLVAEFQRLADWKTEKGRSSPISGVKVQRHRHRHAAATSFTV